MVSDIGGIREPFQNWYFEVKEGCQESMKDAAIFPDCSGSVWTITELNKDVKCRYVAYM